MKRVLPAVLAFFGIACITAAIAVPAWLVPQLRVVPLDLDITSDATTVATDGSPGERFPAVIFDRCSVGEAKAQTFGAHLTQQRRSVIIEPSDSRQATVQSAQTVQIDRTRTADGEEVTPPGPNTSGDLTCASGLLTATIDRVSLNRKTSVPNGTVSSLQLEAAPEGVDPKDVSVQLTNRKGFQYKFGFDVQQRSYLYYDTNTRQDTEAKFVGEETIKGVKTYHFVTEVPETDLSSLPNPQNEAALGTMLTMPAKWWGITGTGVKPNDSINMHRYATATRHVWVEPATGTIVDGREDQHQYFRSPDQSEDTAQPIRDFRLDALKATFKWSDETVTQQAARADKYYGQLRLGGFWLPLILGIVGVLLVLAWLFLFWRGRSARSGEPGDDEPLDGDAYAAGADTEGVAADESATEVVERPDAPTVAEPAAGAPTVVLGKSPAPAVGDGAATDDGYMWDRPTQRIPKVDGPAPRTDGDFGPVDRPER
ncbi:DUF3068 domain-containing protein [Gordonia desulfuricans]|uniref:DUF3068 domain-containing protein n=1 Tax=Gordonia desulfuricans TaxID=89051 RepID=A0A7K3LKI3_9ACTN|nr:DUF3068 domain-containing protein [Gordonia desulfuricans]NDK88571.1 DUF3068 domain-containing protein [Gordonia desulfuricans]